MRTDKKLDEIIKELMDKLDDDEEFCTAEYDAVQEYCGKRNTRFQMKICIQSKQLAWRTSLMDGKKNRKKKIWHLMLPNRDRIIISFCTVLKT